MQPLCKLEPVYYMRVKVILPSIIGNILEWYDFSLYGFFAAVFAKLFFPTSEPLLATLMSFGVFAVGFITRPIGAVLFGYFGDRYGRSKTLAAAIILMAVSTTMIGCLPSYEKIGWTAGLLLVICRLVQGLAVSGEFTGTLIYVTEHAGQRRGWYGSWIMASAFIGLLLGSFVSTAIISTLSDAALYTWGWRLPFILSIFLGAIGLYLRLKMPETPYFLRLVQLKTSSHNPVRRAFREESFTMLKALGLTFLSASAFYITFFYFSFYLKTYLNFVFAEALILNDVSMVFCILLMPILGRLSDRFGRKPFLMMGAIGFLLGVYPLFYYCQQGTLTAMIITQLYLATFLSFICGLIPVTLIELFKTDTRYTALGLPFNLSQALFGGTVPLIMTFFIEHTGARLAPAYYLMLASIVAIVVLLTLKETATAPLR